MTGEEKVTAFLLGSGGCKGVPDSNKREKGNGEKAETSGINTSQLSQLYGAVIILAAIPSCEPASEKLANLPEAKKAVSVLLF